MGEPNFDRFVTDSIEKGYEFLDSFTSGLKGRNLMQADVQVVGDYTGFDILVDGEKVFHKDTKTKLDEGDDIGEAGFYVKAVASDTREGATYFLRIYPEDSSYNTCTCPNFVYRHDNAPCKHLRRTVPA